MQLQQAKQTILLICHSLFLPSADSGHAVNNGRSRAKRQLGGLLRAAHVAGHVSHDALSPIRYRPR